MKKFLFFLLLLMTIAILIGATLAFLKRPGLVEDYADRYRLEIKHELDKISGSLVAGLDFKAAQPRGKIAIVIDDLGWDLRTIRLYEATGIPLTMAVLPRRPRSQYHYQLWKDNYEFIIHMPMEPLGFPDDDPGEYALLESHSPEEIQRKVTELVGLYPRVVGMNNHMGSAFVRSRPGMGSLMELLRKHRLFYLDSRTSPASVALEMAGQHAVSVQESNVFLDGLTDQQHIENQFHRLMRVAEARGEAIAIGHIQTANTARVIGRLAPEYLEQSFEFVNLSELMDLAPLRQSLFTEIDLLVDSR